MRERELAVKTSGSAAAGRVTGTGTGRAAPSRATCGSPKQGLNHYSQDLADPEVNRPPALARIFTQNGPEVAFCASPALPRQKSSWPVPSLLPRGFGRALALGVGVLNRASQKTQPGLLLPLRMPGAGLGNGPDTIQWLFSEPRSRLFMKYCRWTPGLGQDLLTVSRTEPPCFQECFKLWLWVVGVFFNLCCYLFWSMRSLVSGAVNIGQQSVRGGFLYRCVQTASERGVALLERKVKEILSILSFGENLTTILKNKSALIFE